MGRQRLRFRFLSGGKTLRGASIELPAVAFGADYVSMRVIGDQHNCEGQLATKAQGDYASHEEGFQVDETVTSLSLSPSPHELFINRLCFTYVVVLDTRVVRNRLKFFAVVARSFPRVRPPRCQTRSRIRFRGPPDRAFFFLSLSFPSVSLAFRSISCAESLAGLNGMYPDPKSRTGGSVASRRTNG